MKYIALFLLCLLMLACGVDSSVNNNDDPEEFSLLFGSDTSLDIVTWNLQEFPKLQESTLEMLIEIIPQIEADIFCLQEIQSSAFFNELNEALPQWYGYRANSAAYDIDLALLYRNNNEFEILSINELFTDDWWAFPRPPLQIELLWNDEVFYVINNHLKASGGTENEERRRQACQNLADYVLASLPAQNVIIAGDLNDLISDPTETNVFLPFLQDDDNFLMTDYNIAIGSSEFWSWGNGSSHLDHIIISNELFPEFQNSGSEIMTLQIDDYLGSWGIYDTFISDHLPVALKLEF